MKRLSVTVLLLLGLASIISTWQENCSFGCAFEVVVLGFPPFLIVPFSPESNRESIAAFTPFLINLGWIVATSLSIWSVVDTLKRWQERRRGPPVT